MKLTASPAKMVQAPIIEEAPVNIECRVKEIISLGSHDMFIAEVLNVQADEKFIDPQTGKFDMEKAAEIIYKTYGCAVLLKGGHSISDADDLLYENDEITWFESIRIDNPNTHGTGCTLSSAIASNLAKGYSLAESVERAKSYLSGALEAMLDLGKGSGPLMHNYMIAKEA
jgi:hydroxymethylpyrimidine kinase/phosphomethylpyrimidine kinase